MENGQAKMGKAKKLLGLWSMGSQQAALGLRPTASVKRVSPPAEAKAWAAILESPSYRVFLGIRNRSLAYRKAGVASLLCIHAVYADLGAC